jgi:hypothetical protein
MQATSEEILEEDPNIFGIDSSENEQSKVIMSAPASLASIAYGSTASHKVSLNSRQMCFILVREQQDDSGFGFHFTINVDRAAKGQSRRMSTR